MKPVLDALAEIDLADTTRPGGIRARVEEAYDLIHDDVEAAHTGRPRARRLRAFYDTAA